MLKKGNLALDAIKFGCTSLITHIRLIFFLLLAYSGLMVLIIALLALVNTNILRQVISSSNFHTFNQCIGTSYFNIAYQIGAPAFNLFSTHLFQLIISALIIAIFFIGLDLGFRKIALELTDRDTSSIKTLFTSFHFVPQAIIAWFLYCIMVFFGWCCFIVPGFIALLRFAFFPYFIIDKQVGPIEALTMSYDATKNCIWDIFAFWIILKLIIYVGSLIPFGSIITWQLSALAYAYVYRELTKNENLSQSA